MASAAAGSAAAGTTASSPTTATAAVSVGVNRDIERAFLACPDHERIMTIQALAAACPPWQRHLFLAVLEQSQGPGSDVGPEAGSLANDPGTAVIARAGTRVCACPAPLTVVQSLRSRARTRSRLPAQRAVPGGPAAVH